MKQTLSYLLGAIIVVSFVVMLVSFFVTLPKPLVIGDTAALIIAIAIYLFIDREKKDQTYIKSKYIIVKNKNPTENRGV